MRLDCTLVTNGQPRSRTVDIHSLVIGGWTGRDPAAVAHHIEELKVLGVASPAETPCFYRCAASLLTSAPRFQVLGAESAGEVEFVLVMLDDGWWVTTGSDHTDRKVESYSIAVSKQLCHKPVAPQLWRLADVENHWDELILRSRIHENGAEVLYQEGGVTAMLNARDLIQAYRRAGGKISAGMAMFGGTLAVRGGIRPARRFICELEDPVRGRKIVHAYETDALPVA